MNKAFGPKRSKSFRDKYLALAIVAASLITSSLHAQYPTTDSLRRDINKYVTNSAVDAFANRHLNKILYGMTLQIDSAKGGVGGALGVDTLYHLNDSTVRYRKNGVNYTFISKGIYDSRRKVDSLFKYNDSILRVVINGAYRDVKLPGKDVRKINDTTIKIGSDTVHFSNSGGSSTPSNAITFTALRALSGATASVPYQIIDQGKEGLFWYDFTDVISPDDSAMVIISGGKRFKRIVPDGRVNAKHFGAIGNGSADDTYNLQRWLDWLVAHFGSYKKGYLPYGTYKITNGLVIWKDADNNGFPDFVTLEIAGESMSHGFSAENKGTVIYASHVDNFALGIQFGKGVRVHDIAFTGENDLHSLTPAQIYSGDASLFVQSGVRNNTSSPYSAIVVDPFHYSTASINRYPRMSKYYDILVNTGTTGSTDIGITNTFIENFVTGIIYSPNGTSQNADASFIRDSWIQYCKDAVCPTQSQTRSLDITNLKVWGGVHTIFDCVTYGQGNGVMPTVVGMNIAGYNYQLMRLLGGWTNASFTNVYAELLYRLGDWGSNVNGLPVAFNNCYFDIPTGDWYTSAKYINGPGLFTGCTIRQYNNSTGFITSNGTNLTFINCMLSGPVVPYGFILLPNSSNAITSNVKYINCNLYGLPVVGVSGRLNSELFENGNRFGWYDQSQYGVKTAKINEPIFGDNAKASDRSDIPFNYEYGIRSEQEHAIFADGESPVTITFSSSNGTASFPSATPSRYHVGDIIAQQGITAVIDGESVPSTILGVVSSIVGSSVFLSSVPDINPTSVTKTGVTVIAYQQNEFQEPFVGTVTAGSNVITDCRFHFRLHNIRPYTTIISPLFPYFTRITAIDFAAHTVTLSQNALTDDADGVIELTRLIGQGSATQNPNTIDYTAWPLFDSTFSLVVKGSVIANRNNTDSFLVGWRCVRTGFLGTTRPPVFTDIRTGMYTGPVGYNYNPPVSSLSDSNFMTRRNVRDEIAGSLTSTLNFDDNFFFKTDGGTTVHADTTDNLTHLATQYDVASAVGIGLTYVAHDLTLKDSGRITSTLKVDTTVMATRSSVYISIDSLALLTGGTPPDGSETIVIPGTGISVSGIGTPASPYVITNTGTPGSNPFQAVTGAFVQDRVLGAGLYATGTNNTLILQALINSVSANQMIVVPPNCVFSGVLDTIKNKQANVIFLGDSYQRGNDLFIIAAPTSGPDLLHHILHLGTAYNRINMPSHTKANHDAGTGPDWPSFVGTFVKIYNSSKNVISINRSFGHRATVEILGGGGLGSQENTIAGTYFYNNAVGISQRSTNGSSYNDKNHFVGINGGSLRISGGLGLENDGFAGTTYSGAFRSNEYHLLLENVDSIMRMQGDITEPEFDITIEAGVPTGVLGTVNQIQNRVTSPNYVRNPKFTGRGILDTRWLTQPLGRNARITTPIWYLGNTYITDDAKTDDLGTSTIAFVPSSLTQATRNLMPAIFKFKNQPEPDNEVVVTSSTNTLSAGVHVITWNYAGTGTQTFGAGSAAARPTDVVDLYNINTSNAVNIVGVSNLAVLPDSMGVRIRSNGSIWIAQVYYVNSGVGGASDWIPATGGIRYPNHVGIGTNPPTAMLDIAGPNTPSVPGTGVFKLGQQSLLNTPEDGLFERSPGRLWFDVLGLRKEIPLLPDAGGAATQILQWPASGSQLEYVYPSYSLQFTGAPFTISGSTAIQSLVGGAKTMVPGNLAAGDVIEVNCTGFIEDGALSAQSTTWGIVFGAYSTTVAFPLSSSFTTSAPGRGFELMARYTCLTPGTSGTGSVFMVIKISGETLNRYIYTASTTINSVVPTVNATFQFGAGSGTHNGQFVSANIEVKRKQQ